MSINRDFDPFLEQMPPIERLYLDMQHIANQLSEQLANRYLQEVDQNIPRELLRNGYAPFDSVDSKPMLPLSFSGADHIAPNILYTLSDEGETVAIFSCDLYRDGSPLVLSDDMEWLDHHLAEGTGRSDSYEIYAFPERGPILLNNDIVEAVRDIMRETPAPEAAQPDGVITFAEIVAFIEKNGIPCHLLTEEEVSNLMSVLKDNRLKLSLDNYVDAIHNVDEYQEYVWAQEGFDTSVEPL